MEMIFLKIDGGRIMLDHCDILAIEETGSGCTIKTIDDIYQVLGTFDELSGAKMQAIDMENNREDKGIQIKFSAQ